jgi:enamine deaminase RidA (YjgF/YER057c/UK114 family)
MRSMSARTRRRLVKRSAVNPWEWSLKFGFNQGEVVGGQTKVLVCAGQTAVDGDGRPQHSRDMAAQIALALDNLEAVLAGAEMSLGDVVRLNMYTTDVDAFIQHAAVLGERTGAAGIMPPGCLIGVARLALPELMVELEATAMA